MSAIFPLALSELWKGNVDVDGGTLKALPVDSTYTYDATDQFLSDIAAGPRIGTAQTVGSTTFTAGLLGGAGVTFTDVPNLDIIAGLIFYLHTGVEATSRLLVFMDKNLDSTAMGFTSAGTNISASFPNGIAQL